jgi:1,4-dihydroxy-2-naphthoate octaprenyltransferase
MTIAARTSKRGNKIYIVALFVGVWTATAAAFAFHILPIAYALVLAPVWAMQVYQLVSGVGREQWLVARLTGFRVLRVGIALLTLANWFFLSSRAAGP